MSPTDKRWITYPMCKQSPVSARYPAAHQSFFRTQAMCRYYKHIWTCGHVRYVFATFCLDAGLIQTPCGRREVWQSLLMGEDCGDCYVPAAAEMTRSKANRVKGTMYGEPETLHGPLRRQLMAFASKQGLPPFLGCTCTVVMG